MRLGIIPARGGSKGIPRKNLVIVAGKPLLQWTIDPARAARGLDAIAVSSDDPEILALGARLGAHPIERPAALATDEAPMLPVMQHCVRAFEEQRGNKVTQLILLQPTSPLRTVHDIEAALSLYAAHDARAVISVEVVDNKPLKLFLERDDGSLHGLLSDEAPFMRRQDLPRVLQPNGAIYIYEAKCIVDESCLLPRRTLPYIMPKERSVDVDVSDDIARIEAMLS
jgi:CMP-N-acetylneuraminic acid synthetase